MWREATCNVRRGWTEHWHIHVWAAYCEPLREKYQKKRRKTEATIAHERDCTGIYKPNWNSTISSLQNINLVKLSRFLAFSRSTPNKLNATEWKSAISTHIKKKKKKKKTNEEKKMKWNELHHQDEFSIQHDDAHEVAKHISILYAKSILLLYNLHESYFMICYAMFFLGVLFAFGTAMVSQTWLAYD